MTSRASLDAVLDENMGVVYRGAPEQTQAWLKRNSWAWDLSVCVGETLKMTPARDYVRH